MFQGFTATSVIQIDRPPATVFAYLVEPANWPRWVADVKRVDATSPMKKGDAFQETALFRGEERRCRVEVLDAEPSRLLVLRVVEVTSGPDLRPVRRFELSASGTGTRVTWTNDVEVHGLMRAMRPVLPALFRTKMASYLEALKREVESA